MTALYKKGDRHYIKFHIQDGLSVRKSIGLIRDSGLIDTMTMVAQEIKRMTKDRPFTEIRDLVHKAWATVLVRHQRKMLADGLYSHDAISALASTGLDISHLGLSNTEQEKAEPVRANLSKQLPHKLEAMQEQAVQGLTPLIDVDVSDRLEHAEQTTTAPPATTVPASKGLTKAQVLKYWDEFKDLNVKSGRWRLARSGQPQAQSRMNCLMRIGLEHLPDDHVFTKADARTYRGCMLSLPSRWYNSLNKGMTVDEVINSTDPDDTMQADSVNQVMQAHGSFWKYCVDNDYCDSNIWDGLQIRLNKDQEGRKPIDADKIPLVKAHAESLKGWRHALPLLGLYSGARIAELAQLTVHDIDADTKTIKISDDHHGQSIKNSQSKRKIPIPPQVESLILSTRAKAAQAHTDGCNDSASIWYELNGQTLNHRAVTAGASTNRWLRKITGESFHALRHTFATNMVQAGVELELVKSILGHSNSGTTLQVYAKYSTEQMREAMLKLRY